MGQPEREQLAVLRERIDRMKADAESRRSLMPTERAVERGIQSTLAAGNDVTAKELALRDAYEAGKKDSAERYKAAEQTIRQTLGLASDRPLSRRQIKMVSREAKRRLRELKRDEAQHRDAIARLDEETGFYEFLIKASEQPTRFDWVRPGEAGAGLRAHDLVDALRRNAIFKATRVDGTTEAEAADWREAQARAIERSQKFDLTSVGDCGDVSGLARFARELYDNKLLVPPFPQTYLEFYILAGDQRFRISTLATESGFDFISYRHTEWPRYLVSSGGTYDDLFADKTEDSADMLVLIGEAIVSFIVLLASRSSHFREVEPPVRLNRARERRGKPPFYAHRVVTVTPDSSHSEAFGSGRRSPRLHWRRGHIRHYPNYTRWIAPTLVGKAELGEVTHDYRLAGWHP